MKTAAANKLSNPEKVNSLGSGDSAGSDRFQNRGKELLCRIFFNKIKVIPFQFFRFLKKQNKEADRIEAALIKMRDDWYQKRHQFPRF